jgi:arabinofuranosyltransferase
MAEIKKARYMYQDLSMFVVLIALAIYFGFKFVNFDIPPFEDAAMLMRYADNLAHGWGIVWNIGEPPLDGATDFLFMLVVALIHRMGLTMEDAVRLVSIASHLATVALIYIGMRAVQHAVKLAAFFSALYFAAGPGLFLSAAYFGTPLFVLGVASSWLLGQRLLAPVARTPGSYWLFSLACLFTALIRPEGVLIGFFMIAAIAIQLPPAEIRRLVIISGSVFLFFGGAYFLWRWNYFGHPLPNPFYKKGGGSLYFGAMRASIRAGISMGLPMLPVFLLIGWSRRNLRNNLAFTIPIIGSLLMWVLLSDEMNFADRFQYPVLALFVLSWYPVARNLAAEMHLPKVAELNSMQKAAIGLAFALTIFLAFDRHVSNSRRNTYYSDGRYDVALMLSQYADRGYTLASTEAGLIPYYSGWRAIDTWGLNDRWIARNGGLTLEYLAKQEPDVVMWHYYFSPLQPPSVDDAKKPFYKDIMILQQYVEENGFTLAAAYGADPGRSHYYYIRSNLQEHDEIVEAIRTMDYRWFMTGGKSNNFALERSEQQ